MKLKFVQEENSKHGSCVCYLDGKIVDHCDMNKELEYTQAHVVYARAKKTCPNIEIEIIPATNGPGVYSIKDIISMGEMIISEKTKPYCN